MNLMRTRLFRPALFHSKKFLSNYTGDRVLEPLNNRSLLKLRGNDTVSLLQALVTNDVNKLVNNGVGNLYALFLNLKGRVLFDTIIYKLPESDTYLLEVDRAASSSIQKHILLHRVRKDVKIENIDKDYKIWAQFDPSLLSIDPRYDDINLRKEDELSDSAIVLETNDGNVMEFFDPRTSLLGSRIIAHKSASKFVYSNFGNESEQSLYKMYRYRLGIAEGIQELPSGKCIPLEANCDYLNGVSFDKGCYLGQELTARSYHTGVVRKRYMPIFFHEDNGDEIQDENVTAFDKKVGVLRGRKNNVGIALLRIAQVENKTLIADGMKAFTSKPFWWPQKQIALNQELSDKPKESFVTAPKSIY